MADLSDRIAKSLFTFLLTIIFIDLALQAMIAMVVRFLPLLIGLALVVIGLTVVVTVCKQSLRRPRTPLLPPNTPSLSAHKRRRARSTGGGL